MKLIPPNSWRGHRVRIDEDGQLLAFDGDRKGMLISQPAYTLNVKAITRLSVDLSAAKSEARAEAHFSDGQVFSLIGNDLEILTLKLMVKSNQQEGIDPYKETSVINLFQADRKDVLDERCSRVKEAALLVAGAAYLVMSLILGLASHPFLSLLFTLIVFLIARYKLEKKLDWSFFVYDEDVDYYRRVVLRERDGAGDIMGYPDV